MITTQEKNEEIVLMLGWAKTEYGYVLPNSLESGYDYGEWADKTEIEHPDLYKGCMLQHYVLDKSNLRFERDANWQFEALEFIEKLDHKDNHYQWNDGEETQYNFAGYETDIENKRCSIWMHLELDPPERVAYFEGSNKKEAIFECLYQFSQYIKSKLG